MAVHQLYLPEQNNLAPQQQVGRSKTPSTTLQMAQGVYIWPDVVSVPELNIPSLHTVWRRLKEQCWLIQIHMSLLGLEGMWWRVLVVHLCANCFLRQTCAWKLGLFRTLLQSGLIILDQNSNKGSSFNTCSLQTYFWPVVLTSKPLRKSCRINLTRNVPHEGVIARAA